MDTQFEQNLKIGAAIKDLRSALGKSQQAFAGLIDASINSVAKYEIGSMKPGHDRLARCLTLAVQAGATGPANVFRRDLMTDCYVTIQDLLHTLNYHVPQISLDLDEIASDKNCVLSSLALGRVESIKKHLGTLLSAIADTGQAAHGDMPATTE